MSIAVSQDRNHRYSVVVESQVLSSSGPSRTVLSEYDGEALVVVDEEVWQRWGHDVGAFLAQAPHRILRLPGGEANKTLGNTLEVVKAMDECQR
ncbi:hypothetical protein AB0M58_26730 [Streptomyces bobili]|uniref:hypothetical protein n=1 Tax=Streptomyces bobili TaxID=67280 RepID=UPI003446A839